MFLSNRKCVSKYLNHELGKSPNVDLLTPEEISPLLEKARKEELLENEREILIKNYIRLAINIAGRYANVRPSIADDMVSEGIRGIIYAVDLIKEKLVDDNLTAWVTANIHRFIGHLVLMDSLIPIPISTRTKMKKENRAVPELKRQTITEKVAALRKDKVKEIKEEIYSCCKDTIDKFILDMRLQGFEDQEIAGFLDVSKSNISSRRNRIEKTFNKKGYP